MKKQHISMMPKTINIIDLTEEKVAELACALSAMVLHDDKQPITSQGIIRLVREANVTMDPMWAQVFSQTVRDEDIISFLGLENVELWTFPTIQERNKAQARELKKLIAEDESAMQKQEKQVLEQIQRRKQQEERNRKMLQERMRPQPPRVRLEQQQFGGLFD